MLLDDTEDLIHKAAGWMLREVGKRSPQTEEAFLKGVQRRMPRTMLRYAIERFPEARRKACLRGEIQGSAKMDAPGLQAGPKTALKQYIFSTDK